MTRIRQFNTQARMVSRISEICCETINQDNTLELSFESANREREREKEKGHLSKNRSVSCNLMKPNR
jgi:ribosomal protein S1